MNSSLVECTGSSGERGLFCLIFGLSNRRLRESCGFSTRLRGELSRSCPCAIGFLLRFDLDRLSVIELREFHTENLFPNRCRKPAWEIALRVKNEKRADGSLSRMASPTWDEN